MKMSASDEIGEGIKKAKIKEGIGTMLAVGAILLSIIVGAIYGFNTGFTIFVLGLILSGWYYFKK